MGNLVKYNNTETRAALCCPILKMIQERAYEMVSFFKLYYAYVVDGIDSGDCIVGLRIYFCVKKRQKYL